MTKKKLRKAMQQRAFPSSTFDISDAESGISKIGYYSSIALQGILARSPLSGGTSIIAAADNAREALAAAEALIRVIHQRDDELSLSIEQEEGAEDVG